MDMYNYFTRKGYENYLKEISQLEEKLRNLESQVQHTIEAGGGWHDNASYEHLVEDINVMNNRLNEAHKLLFNIEILSYPKNVETIVLGCEVEALFDGIKVIYKIVAHGEANVDENKILYISPLAKIMFGHKPGDLINANIGNRDREIKILSIKPLKE